MKKRVFAIIIFSCLALFTLSCIQESHIHIGYEHEGLIRIEEGGKVGFEDTDGNIVIPLEYDWAWDFHEGLVTVEKDGKWGYIDNKGHIVAPLEYDWAYSFCQGRAAVAKDGKMGFIDTNGNIVAPIEYDDVWDFHEGLAAVEKNGKMGFIDNNGQIVIPLEYDSYYGIHGYLDDSVLFNFGEWEEEIAVGFYEGLAQVNKSGKWGFIDKTGQVIIPFIYDGTSGFHRGLAWVEKEGKFGYINAKGWVVVPLISPVGWIITLAAMIASIIIAVSVIISRRRRKQYGFVEISYNKAARKYSENI